MRLAQVVDGVVVNLIEVSAGSVPAWAASWPAAAADVDIGHTWNGSGFAPPGPDVEAAAAAALAMRDKLIAAKVDPYAGNVLAWAELHPLKQAELAAYRAALMAIVDQAGYPLSIEWPAAPVI